MSTTCVSNLVPKKINIISDLKIPHKQESHVKFLFKDELLQEEKTQKQIDFENNNRVENGMCYICAYNINIKNVGIKCLNCVRTYHPQCIRKHNNMPPIVRSFICKACAKGKTS